MARNLVLEVYVAVGLATAAWVTARREGWGLRLAAVPLWPFLLPALIGVGSVPPPKGTAADADLDELARKVAESWARGPAARVEGDRERQVIEGFVTRLRGLSRRIADIEAAHAQAPARAQASLRKLSEAAGVELRAGIELLEELLAQLVLLRFATSLTSGGLSDRARIEDLLERIESVVNLQTTP